MNYTIKRSKRKTLALSIVDGELIVRSPYHLNERFIDAFVLSKKDWVEKKLKDYRPMGINLESNKIRLWGKMRSLEIIKANRFKMEMSDSLIIHAPTSWSQKRLIIEIEEELKKVLYLYLDEKVESYSKTLNIKKPSFIIRRYKRMHGRCNQRHELAFNLYLFHESLDFIDYVVLHECAHILEFNHSKNFYAIIEAIMPHYKAVIASNKL